MTIWIPESAKTADRPRFQCRVCDDRFVTQPAFEAHVLKCAEIHDNELREAADWWREFNAPIDPEWAAYNRELRRRGLDPMVQYGRPKNTVKRLGES